MTFTPDFASARAVASPNHDARTGAIDILLLHYTGMTSGEAALERLCDRIVKVSAHYLVYEDGRIDQLVPEARRAWHAGLASWHGATDINSRAVGIEIVNPGHANGYCEFPHAQIEALIPLCQDILARHAIPPARVLGHSDVAPARKEDPGEKFPWARLAACGIGRWIDPMPIGTDAPLKGGDRGAQVADLQRALARFGYAADLTHVYDTATAEIVTAFQRHFRPERVDGLADASTRNTLARLLAAQ